MCVCNCWFVAAACVGIRRLQSNRRSAIAHADRDCCHCCSDNNNNDNLLLLHARNRLDRLALLLLRICPSACMPLVILLDATAATGNWYRFCVVFLFFVFFAFCATELLYTCFSIVAAPALLLLIKTFNIKCDRSSLSELPGSLPPLQTFPSS